MGIKVALVTDMDVKPTEWAEANGKTVTPVDIEAAKTSRVQSLADFENVEVKAYVSPNWTLEYELALSPFRKELYRSILWAEKIKNSSGGVPQQSKRQEVDAKAEKDFDEWLQTWTNDDRQNERIAYEIYYRAMVENGISKSVTAQVFADHLERGLSGPDANVVRSQMQGAETLKYLLDAIYHVTESREARNEG